MWLVKNYTAIINHLNNQLIESLLELEEWASKAWINAATSRVTSTTNRDGQSKAIALKK